MKKIWFALLAFALVGLPLAETAYGQFPAESTIPKAKRRPRQIAKGPEGPVPRMADGTADLSGLWGYSGYTSDIFKDYDVGEVPMTPLAERLFKERQANEGVEDPEARCLPTGVPRRDPYPWQILQTPKIIAILFEGNIHSFRQIYMNEKHPENLEPTWYGHSVGKWIDKDTLEVDTIGFNGKTWLDMAGHGSSDKLHVIERFRRTNYGTLVNEIIIEDPEYYTKPVKVVQTTPLFTEGPMIEYICQENERDSQHLDKQIQMSQGK